VQSIQPDMALLASSARTPEGASRHKSAFDIGGVPVLEPQQNHGATFRAELARDPRTIVASQIQLAGSPVGSFGAGTLDPYRPADHPRTARRLSPVLVE
jgi:hypothetical protein